MKKLQGDILPFTTSSNTCQLSLVVYNKRFRIVIDAKGGALHRRFREQIRTLSFKSLKQAQPYTTKIWSRKV